MFRQNKEELIDRILQPLLVPDEERFHRDLTEVFGDRCQEFSQPLQVLLRKFWEQAQSFGNIS